MLGTTIGGDQRGENSEATAGPSSRHQSSDVVSEGNAAVAVAETTALWVFGYGSLCWHQGFDYTASMIGYVRGYSRRFWQGNNTHRGTVRKPGRVATLVEDCEGIVWGQAFQIEGEAALPYLNQRECQLGGYLTTFADFHPRYNLTKPFPVMVYVATPSNSLWLGDGPLTEIAEQILTSSGPSGHNVEYLLRLAQFVRDETPEAYDEHLFMLEALVREQIVDRKMCLRTLMGDEPLERKVVGRPVQPASDDPNAEPEQFSQRVPSKQLRCVKIS